MLTMPERAGSSHDHHAAGIAPARKVEIVLRLLRGETLGTLASETGRPPKQLGAWQRRFLEGGEDALGARIDRAEVEALRTANGQLSSRLAELEEDNRRLSRRLALLAHGRSGQRAPHPFCSEPYALALEEPGVRPLYVSEWRTYVLVRTTGAGLRQATGVRPIASLDPGSDVRAGLDALRAQGMGSVSLVTDPMWCPDVTVLNEAFTSCRPFKESFFIDRESERVHVRKRHRNMVNRARRTVEVRELRLDEQLGRWLDLYGTSRAGRSRSRSPRGTSRPWSTSPDFGRSRSWPAPRSSR
jgi:transposase-like protein